MVKRFNMFMSKIGNFIEKMRLSETDYLMMKDQSEKYKSMMSTMNVDTHAEFENIETESGIVLRRFPKSQTVTLNVDVKDMLRAGGVICDLDPIKLNVE